MSCRTCSAATGEVLALGNMPPANWLMSAPDEHEESFPLVLEWRQPCDVPETLSAEAVRDCYLPAAWICEQEIIRKVRQSGNATSRSIVPAPSVRLVA